MRSTGSLATFSKVSFSGWALRGPSEKRWTATSRSSCAMKRAWSSNPGCCAPPSSAHLASKFDEKIDVWSAPVRGQVDLFPKCEWVAVHRNPSMLS